MKNHKPYVGKPYEVKDNVTFPNKISAKTIKP